MVAGDSHPVKDTPLLTTVRLVLAAGSGTVLRATQFHEFAAQMFDRGGPFVIAPKMRCQPVALVEVAAHLVELAHGQPRGHAPELAGPEELWMQDMVRQLSRARHSRRPVVPIRLPGNNGKQFMGGALLPTAPGPRGTITFATWRLSRRSAPSGVIPRGRLWTIPSATRCSPGWNGANS